MIYSNKQLNTLANNLSFRKVFSYYSFELIHNKLKYKTFQHPTSNNSYIYFLNNSNDQFELLSISSFTFINPLELILQIETHLHPLHIEDIIAKISSISIDKYHKFDNPEVINPNSLISYFFNLNVKNDVPENINFNPQHITFSNHSFHYSFEKAYHTFKYQKQFHIIAFDNMASNFISQHPLYYNFFKKEMNSELLIFHSLTQLSQLNEPFFNYYDFLFIDSNFTGNINELYSNYLINYKKIYLLSNLNSPLTTYQLFYKLLSNKNILLPGSDVINYGVLENTNYLQLSLHFNKSSIKKMQLLKLKQSFIDHFNTYFFSENKIAYKTELYLEKKTALAKENDSPYLSEISSHINLHIKSTDISHQITFIIPNNDYSINIFNEILHKKIQVEPSVFIYNNQLNFDNSPD